MMASLTKLFFRLGEGDGAHGGGEHDAGGKRGNMGHGGSLCLRISWCKTRRVIALFQLSPPGDFAAPVLPSARPDRADAGEVPNGSAGTMNGRRVP